MIKITTHHIPSLKMTQFVFEETGQIIARLQGNLLTYMCDPYMRMTTKVESEAAAMESIMSRLHNIKL